MSIFDKLKKKEKGRVMRKDHHTGRVYCGVDPDDNFMVWDEPRAVLNGNYGQGYHFEADHIERAIAAAMNDIKPLEVGVSFDPITGMTFAGGTLRALKELSEAFRFEMEHLFDYDWSADDIA